MNMIGTQAAGLQKFFDGLTPPPVEHDREVMLHHDPPDVPRMIIDAKTKANRLSRLDELVGIAHFIGSANLLECKHIINELIDRTSTITGCATELENAACSLSRSIEIDGDVDAEDSLRSYMERKDEA